MVKTFRVMLHYPDGKAMFAGTVTAEELIEAQAKAERAAVMNGQRDQAEKVTDLQKRYLFRLLAAQGVEGETAEDHLKIHFGVLRLSDVPKAKASAYIDQIVQDRKDTAARTSPGPSHSNNGE